MVAIWLLRPLLLTCNTVDTLDFKLSNLRPTRAQLYFGSCDPCTPFFTCFTLSPAIRSPGVACSFCKPASKTGGSTACRRS